MALSHSCFVYIQLPGTYSWVTCASLKITEVSAGAFVGDFIYGKRYLSRTDAVALDEVLVPLNAESMQFTKLKGVPGPIRDAAPDHWGRRVIQAKLERGEQDLGEMDYLLNGPDDGAGNLRFGTTTTPSRTTRPFNKTRQLAELIEAAQALQADGRLPHEVLEQLEPGTSMGGARPKVSIEEQKKIWLAKLPERDDRHNVQRIEYATLELARKAGLTVCGTRLEHLEGADALMLERFDREWNPDEKAYARYALVSGLTLLNAEDGHVDRERWSYLLMAQELRRRSSKPQEDCLEFFRRMVFNAMVTNNDDHPRNHAMLQTPQGWRLSPAYDIVPVRLMSLERRDLALTVGKFGRTASIYNLISQCEEFGLPKEDALAEIARMRAIVDDWREHYKSAGVDSDGMAMLEQAILPPCFDFLEPIQQV